MILMNLIPSSAPSPVSHYLCTWNAQLQWQNPQGRHDGYDDVAVFMRDRFCMPFLFGRDGLLTAVPQAMRGDMLALLDDGWDVPRGTTHHGNAGTERFGSLLIDGEKFPELAHLPPADRLKALSDRVKEMGFAGLGLWVPSSHFGEDVEKSWDERRADGKAYWEEKAPMLAYADVRYIKVDWGFHGRDVVYRKAMTDAMRKFSPQTLVEHVIGVYRGPYDLPPEVLDADPAFRDFMDVGRQTVAVSDVYRTYDVVEEFKHATTLARLAYLFDGAFTTDPASAGLVNVEDSPLIAAGLCMSLGMMTLPTSPDVRDFEKAMRFSRIAPPFRLDANDRHVSEKWLTDRYHFHKNKAEWPHIGDEILTQKAPAVLSRGTALPAVSAPDDDRTPFVLASAHPNGALAVCSIDRTGENGTYACPASVACSGAKIESPVGVFGAYKSLRIRFDGDLSGTRIFAQNLLADEAVDVTDRIGREGDTLVLSGELLREIGSTGEKETDASVFLATGAK